MPDIICFARDYERLSAQLKIEAPVLIRGTIMKEEDAAPKISISGIQSLEEVQVKLPAGIRIRINLATRYLLRRRTCISFPSAIPLAFPSQRAHNPTRERSSFPKGA